MEGRLIRANRRPAENMTFSRTLYDPCYGVHNGVRACSKATLQHLLPKLVFSNYKAVYISIIPIYRHQQLGTAW